MATKKTAKKSEKLPVASFWKGKHLTFAETQEFRRLKGSDGTGKFQFAPKPKGVK